MKRRTRQTVAASLTAISMLMTNNTVIYAQQPATAAQQSQGTEAATQQPTTAAQQSQSTETATQQSTTAAQQSQSTETATQQSTTAAQQSQSTEAATQQPTAEAQQNRSQINMQVFQMASVTEYNGVDYAAVFDADYYYNQYPDLQAAFGEDAEALLAHFVTCGMREGRRACADFIVQDYKANYADLRAAFGDDLPAYYLHYVTNGQAEGRVADRLTETEEAEKEAPYAAVYSYSYYKQKYSDLRAAFGDDRAAYFNHFLQYGMKEGRQAVSSFNVVYYRKNYADLRAAFGNDLPAYYQHYISCGKAEGRVAGQLLEVYSESDYTAVYQYQYYKNAYADLRAAFGDDEAAYLEHFVKYGMAEGRRGCAGFNVQIYKANYPALQEKYGNDLKQYYLDYIKTGAAAGRNASSLISDASEVNLTEGTYILKSSLNTDYAVNLGQPHYENNSGAILWESDGSNEQKWKITKDSSGYYRLQAQVSGKYLSVAADGSSVVQKEADGAADQQWKAMKRSDGSIQLISVSTGEYLTVSGAEAAEDVPMQVQKAGTAAAQSFVLESTSYVPVVQNGYYILSSSADTGYAAEVLDGNATDGVNIQIGAADGTNAQKFYITYIGDGAYTVATAVSGRESRMDVAGAETADHTNVQEWEANESDAQKWHIYALGSGNYVLESACGGKVLEIADQTASEGANLDIASYQSADTQKFQLTATTLASNTTAEKLRAKIVALAESYLGYNESDGSYRQIIDIYNRHSPLAGGYKMGYEDEWCAAFASAMAIQAGLSDKDTGIIPTECGCQRQVLLWIKLGCWVEADDYTPAPGDFIYYYWSDNATGAGDCTGDAQHVGIVETAPDADGYFTVIEGNHGDAPTSVARTTRKVNQRCIRGYGIPDYTGFANR